MRESGCSFQCCWPWALLLPRRCLAAAQTKLRSSARSMSDRVNDYGYNRSDARRLEAMKKAVPGVKLLEAENVPETAESSASWKA